MSIENRGPEFAHPGHGHASSPPETTRSPGQCLAVIGAGGLGEKVFLNLLFGLSRPDAETREGAGAGVHEPGTRRAEEFRARSAGDVFQNLVLSHRFSARNSILHRFGTGPSFRELRGPPQ